jgi:hypothetical protein
MRSLHGEEAIDEQYDRSDSSPIDSSLLSSPKSWFWSTYGPAGGADCAPALWPFGENGLEEKFISASLALAMARRSDTVFTLEKDGIFIKGTALLATSVVAKAAAFAEATEAALAALAAMSEAAFDASTAIGRGLRPDKDSGTDSARTADNFALASASCS